LFGGESTNSIRRLFFKKFRFDLKTLSNILPYILQSFLFQKSFLHRFEDRAFAQFVERNPEFLEILSRAEKITNNVKNKDSIFCILRNIAEKYQLGISALSSEEHLLMDEGFCQKAKTIWWRSGRESFFFEEYFQSLPIPDIIIHIDAPANVALNRQVERNRMITKNAEVHESVREFFSDMVNHLESNHDTKIIYVENTGTVEEAVEQIENELKKLGVL